MTEPANAQDVARENEALLNGYWCRAVEALVEQGVPWPEAAKSMLSIAALQVEAALGAGIAQQSLAAARDYMAGKAKTAEDQTARLSNAQH